jgi:hypothetical protein
MNHREPSHATSAARRARHCLSLLLLPALGPESSHASVRQRVAQVSGLDLQSAERESVPYLLAFSSPSLRFQEAPPDLATRPAAAGPPMPGLNPAETAVAQANASAAHPAATQDQPALAEKSEPKPPGLAAPKATPTAILPDETRPQVRPEDFLPYFQIPGATPPAGDVTPYVPPARSAPVALPPSTATYRQTP